MIEVNHNSPPDVNGGLLESLIDNNHAAHPMVDNQPMSTPITYAARLQEAISHDQEVVGRVVYRQSERL